MEMKYVKGAMNESHRMVPVVQGLGRKTQKDLVLSGYQVNIRQNIYRPTILFIQSGTHCY